MAVPEVRMARKVQKTVSPQFVRILIVGQAMVVLSVFYLIDWYYNRRPMPSWVPVLAWGTFVTSLAFGVASRIVPRLRSQLVILRSRLKALPPTRRTVAQVYGFLIGTCGIVGPYLIWTLIPQGVDYSRPPGYDLAIFAFAALEASLFLTSLKYVSGSTSR
jgi:hypothetical protein